MVFNINRFKNFKTFSLKNIREYRLTEIQIPSLCLSSRYSRCDFWTGFTYTALYLYCFCTGITVNPLSFVPAYKASQSLSKKGGGVSVSE